MLCVEFNPYCDLDFDIVDMLHSKDDWRTIEAHSRMVRLYLFGSWLTVVRG